mmetsp:Transcript_12071/g.18238  ORF Transcript_12071/g.18238 Transcript_12071/m.18238 type:complete len:98 (-) Transcript_12071:189-482(-)
MCCSAITFAKCCTFYSISGIIFLFIIGILLDSQGVYIQGVDDADKGSENCYIGAVLYIVSLVISVGYWIYYEHTQSRTIATGKRGGFDSKEYGSFQT